MGKGKIEEIINKIKKFKQDIGVEKIIFFGSYPTGRYSEDSDIDLILVSKNFEGKDFHSRFKGLWMKWNLGLPVDFIPFTPGEFKKLSKQISIVSEALKEGIVI